MENDFGYSRRTRSASRASSTSSSLEVRCACQYYRSDSLLPERSALAAASAVSNQSRTGRRPLLRRMVQTPPAGRKSQPVRCGEHEYEPIGQPLMRMAVSQHSLAVRMVAPVVKITDTDVIPVVDSDDSIDDRYRYKQRALVLEGDVVLPLDGRIEDSVMDGRNLGDQTIDNSIDELETPQQLQDRLEERFKLSATSVNESKPDVEINTNQVDSSATDDPSRRNARGLQQRLKSSAGKIRSRIKNIQKPNFTMPQMPHRQNKSAKPTAEPTTEPTTVTTTTITATVTEKPPASPRPADQKASRMERFRMALPERPRFSMPDKSKFHFPDKSKFHLPDKSKFHLPDRSKFHLPERPKFNIDKSKFQIKKPNIQLPKSLSRPKKSTSQRSSLSREQSQASNVDASSSTSATRRNIFDFSTLPRPKIFDRKSKTKTEYVTSSPKQSRAQSTESSTFPRAKKSISLGARWAQRFGETVKGLHHDDSVVPTDRSTPWRHPSLEQPRLSLKPQTSEEEEEKLPWENTERVTYDAEDEAIPDDEDESREISYGERNVIGKPELSFDKMPVKDPRLYDDQLMAHIVSEEPKKKVRLIEEDQGSLPDPEADDEHHTYHPKELYDGSFPPVDPREFGMVRSNSVDLSEDEELSMRSDREIQQSSGSSCERRRQGVIEEIDSDEFFLREKGISQENMRFTLISEIRDALRPRTTVQIEEIPPQRPKRTRSQRKRRDESVESYDLTPPPEKPKRERSSLRQSRESFQNQSSLERANSLSRHRIVYQAELLPTLQTQDDMVSEPLDDIVVVKPARRKSRSSLRSISQSRLPVEEQNIVLAPIEQMLTSETPPPQVPVPLAPRRRKRLRRDNTNQSSSLSIRTNDSALCNGFHDTSSLQHSHERIPLTPPPTPPPLSHLDELDYIEPVVPVVISHPPIPPKRTRSHSRTASLAPEDDHTSHGAESLPGDFGYADEDDIPVIPRDSSSREPSLPGYAVIEKREKPPRPPPPRRKKQDKFATAPRSSKNAPPKRPLRGYSTLRPAKSETIRKSVDSIPFMDGDYSLQDQETHTINGDDDFHKDLRSGEVLSKMQGRPLPAPPRPPRHRRVDHQSRRSLPREITPDFSETVASTQTDPLPDDLVIEEEITTAKLIVTPSRHGSSQVLISTERIPSPTNGSYKSLSSNEPKTPPIPPLPSNLQQRDSDRTQAKHTDERDYKVPPSDEPRRLDQAQLEMLRSALFSTEGPLRIPSLEVGDLKVDRLTVSQLEAYKVAASEIDAIVVSATELSNRGDTEGGIHPSLLQELIAIRNQLEAVASTQPQSRPQSVMEDACTATSNERIDIPLEESNRAAERRQSFTREISPLLIVEQSVPDQEATKVMGRASLPLSSSTSDLTAMTSDSTSVSEITTTIISTEATEEPVITITEAPFVESSQDNVPDEKQSNSRPNSPESHLARSSSPSRSRSSSPSRGLPGAVRQTASPVKSLPPVISVTPDNIVTPESILPTGNNDKNIPLRHVTSSGVKAQRAVISYQSSNEDMPTSPSRETSQSPPPPARHSSPQPPSQDSNIEAKFIAFPTSQIPASFFALANPPLSSSVTDHHQQQQRRVVEVEPSIADMTGQLLRALRLAGTRSLRHFVDSVVSRFASPDETEEVGVTSMARALNEEKVRRVELAMCTLLLLIAGLIIMFICTPRTVTHHHHWDYFNPPQ